MPRSLSGRPIRIGADHRAEIGRLHLEAAAEVHLVGFDDATCGFSSAQTIPASTAEVTCRPVAFW